VFRPDRGDWELWTVAHVKNVGADRTVDVALRAPEASWQTAMLKVIGTEGWKAWTMGSAMATPS
jgi:hypothetical protein